MWLAVDDMTVDELTWYPSNNIFFGDHQRSHQKVFRKLFLKKVFLEFLVTGKLVSSFQWKNQILTFFSSWNFSLRGKWSHFSENLTFEAKWGIFSPRPFSRGSPFLISFSRRLTKWGFLNIFSHFQSPSLHIKFKLKSLLALLFSFAA